MKAGLVCAGLFGVSTCFTIAAAQADAALLVSNSESNTIVVFDETTGSVVGNFTTPGNGGLRAPDDLTFGPDGNLYVSVGGDSGLNLLASTYPRDSAVLKFNPYGEFLGVAAAGNGLSRPYGNAFGPDGSLYVSSFRTNQILRFDGKTGAFLNVFASDNSGGLGSVNGLNGPNGLLFAPDGSLYVTTEGSANDANGDLTFAYDSQILRYSPDQVAGRAATTTPEVFVPQLAPLPEAGFVSLLGLALAPDEKSLYVSDFAGGIRQFGFDGTLLNVLSTNYTGTVPSGNYVGSLTFGSDNQTLYGVGFDFNTNVGSVLKFPNAEGSPIAFTGTAFTSDWLIRPIGITVAPAEAVPEPLTIAGTCIALGGFGILRKRTKSV